MRFRDMPPKSVFIDFSAPNTRQRKRYAARMAAKAEASRAKKMARKKPARAA